VPGSAEKQQLQIFSLQKESRDPAKFSVGYTCTGMCSVGCTQGGVHQRCGAAVCSRPTGWQEEELKLTHQVSLLLTGGTELHFAVWLWVIFRIIGHSEYEK
jgi:hypothetical protein